ncbi:MAG: response regulator [Oscillospiraceae bacterium]|nr:response regulator [Oscillospiraceae bacterium]
MEVIKTENTRKKIIIVDDNAANLTTVRELLKPHYEVFPAPSAIKLFTIMGNLIPDLVLLDIDMPGMSGFEVMQVMSENPRFKNIPVIILTGLNDIESEIEGFNLGAADYVTKPFSGALLLRRVSNLLLIEQQKQEIEELRAKLNA